MFGLKKKKDPLDEFNLPDMTGLDGNKDHLDSNLGMSDSFNQSSFQDSFSSNSKDKSDFTNVNQPIPEFDNSFSSNPHSQNNPSSQSDSFINQNPFGQNPDPNSPQNSPHSFDSVQPMTPKEPVSNHQLEQRSGSDSYEKSAGDYNMELMLSKMDVIKSMIENLSHRITVLENKLDRDMDQRKRQW